MHLMQGMRDKGYRPHKPTEPITWKTKFAMVREDTSVVAVESKPGQIGKKPSEFVKEYGWAWIKDSDTRQADGVSTTDITANRHGGNEESKAAHKRSLTHAARDRARILELLEKKGALGATCEELSQELDLGYTTASGRCSELKKDSLVVPNGAKRKTTRGCDAAVLVRPHFLADPF